MSVQTSYQKAFFFAAQQHQQVPQWIKGTTDVPYAVHIGNVAMEIIMAHHETPCFNLELAVQIALLHDVLEDTPCPETILLEEFGEAVTTGVKALTKNKNLKDKNPMEDSIERILGSNPEVGMVKLADRITNLQPPPHFWSREKIELYYHEAVLLWEKLGHLNVALSQRMAEQLLVYRSFF
jgi:guanosine-3',5'-bis(diphosphate) 3'-pyrophosphohydrolase